ncbi:MAG: hypothetical protein ACJ8R9_31865 [Steroidobacteraceae bacterium]
MRPISIATYSLACLVAAWLAGCATERLASVAPSGVNLTGEWKFNPNLSDDPDKLADPDKTPPERAPGGRRGRGGGRGGGSGMPPMPPIGSSPLATTTGHGFAACGERVAMDGHPGLAQSTDCAAQWPGRDAALATATRQCDDCSTPAAEAVAPTANAFQRVALTAPGIEQAAPLPPASTPPTTGGSATSPASPAGPNSRGASINRLLKAPVHVSIIQKEGTLTINTDMPDGTHTADEYTAGTSSTIPYGPDKTADRSVGWRGPAFVITTSVKKGGWREDDFALDEDGRLIMTTQTKGGRLGSVDITRVYDRIR